MKVLEIRIDDSIFGSIKNLLDLLPPKKITYCEIYDDSHIPYISDSEQIEISKKLKKKGCHEVARSKTVKL
jgi:hypothetical protein